MRTILIALSTLFATATAASAESIGGFWLSAEGRSGGCAIVEFVKSNGAYDGKVVAILENDNKESVGNFMFTGLRKKTAKKARWKPTAAARPTRPMSQKSPTPLVTRTSRMKTPRSWAQATATTGWK